MFQNGSKRSTFFKIVKYGPILSETVQNSPKSFKVSTNFTKWSDKVQIPLKSFQKISLIGVTAVGVTAVRNYLKF